MKSSSFIFNALYVILIVSLIGFMLWVVMYMKDNRTNCLRDPIGYFEEKNEGASCSCMKDGIMYPNTVKVERVEPKYEEINFANFEFKNEE